MEYLLGRINADTHFKAYIDRTYALTPQAFDKLSLLYCYMTEKKRTMYTKKYSHWLENHIGLSNHYRKKKPSIGSNKAICKIQMIQIKKNCYHALLTGKEQHGYNKIINLNTLSDIICSLNDLKKLYASYKWRKKNRVICLDPATAFFEVNALDQKKISRIKNIFKIVFFTLTAKAPNTTTALSA